MEVGAISLPLFPIRMAVESFERGEYKGKMDLGRGVYTSTKLGVGNCTYVALRYWLL